MDVILQSPVLLDTRHDINNFDCGVHALNLYLKSFASQNIKNNSAKTYVATRSNIVVGYHSLAFGSVFHEEAPARITKGLAKHPVPIILLARLAVDNTEKGQGLGKALLKDALLRTLQASEIAGLRAVLVHAKDNNAKKFYEKFGFESSPIDPFHLFLLIKDLRQILLC